ncbi:MAG: CPBP family intramembrane metalloprotease [Myxococcales bacterium]|nr:CPBP family intramembrane metalloprotease [Myxococcales bacterium]
MRWHAALGYVVLATLGALGVQLVAAGVRMLRGASFGEAAAAVMRDPLSLGLAQLLAFGAAILWGVRGHDGVPAREALALRPTSWTTLGLAALAGAALQLPLAEVGNLVHELIGRDLRHAHAVRDLLRIDGALDGVLVVLAVVVIAPVVEELLFRGLLLPGLARAYDERVALVLSALFFGLMHGRPAAAVVAFLAGLVLGAIRLRTRSVLPGLALHAMVNAVPVLVPPELFAIPSVNVFADEVLHVPLPLVLGSAALAAAALAALVWLDDADE